MADREPAQQYVVFDPEGLMKRKVDEPLTPESIKEPLWDILRQTHTGLSQDDYVIESVPLVTSYLSVADARPPFTPQVVFSVSFPCDESADKFRAAVLQAISDGNRALDSIGINPAIAVGEFSVPVAPDGALFGTLDDARHLINADRLPAALDGHSVNVVVIDAGIDRSIVPPGQYGGGWHPMRADPTLPTPPLPGHTTGADALHGMMIVNNILAMAPRATIFDVPLIPPPKIYHIPHFLHAAHATYHRILHDIPWLRTHGFPGPWIFMNAWAIFDRRSEGTHLGEYTENLGIGGVPPHHFIRQIEKVAQAKFDIVFCAGNCGEVCPDDRCGPDDFGPGRGIWGANAHRDVLTAGAVRVDAIWPGYSSEGPGPTPHLYAQKPDLCAPSQFVGTRQYPPNTGTSASAAIAAGIVAALRSWTIWNQTTVHPYMLKLILNNTAMQTQGPGWNRWLGNGVLDAYAAYLLLGATFPPPPP
jgi:hypothetical protein